MNGFVTTNLQDNEIVKADDVQIAGDNSILNMEKFFKVLVNAKKNVVIGGKLKAYITGNLLAAKMDPVIGYNIETEEMFSDHEGKVYMDGSDTISDYILFSPADTSDRIDTVEMKSEILEGNLQSRQFYNPTTEGTSSSPTNIEKRKIVRCKVLKGIPGSNAAPSVENGYVKIAEVVISASVSELTDSDIKNITADIDTENTSWTMDKNSVINPGSIQEAKDIFRKIHNSDGTLKNEVVKAANILLSGTGSLNGSNILKGGATEVISETTSILPNDSIATAMNKTVNAIAECKEELTSYVDGKDLTDFGGVADITQGGTGATTEKSAQYNLIGNTPESVDIELEENQMMYLENPNKSAETGSMIKIKLGKFRDWISSVVKVTKESIGLGNVDNTADKDKSVSYAANSGKLNNKAESALSVSYASSAGSAPGYLRLYTLQAKSSGTTVIDGVTITHTYGTISGSSSYYYGIKPNKDIIVGKMMGSSGTEYHHHIQINYLRANTNYQSAFPYGGGDYLLVYLGRW